MRNEIDFWNSGNSMCMFSHLLIIMKSSKDVSFLPVGRVVTSGGMKAVREYYEKLGQNFVDGAEGDICFGSDLTLGYSGPLAFQINQNIKLLFRECHVLLPFYASFLLP